MVKATHLKDTHPGTDGALMRFIRLLEWCEEYTSGCASCQYSNACNKIYENVAEISSKRRLSEMESTLFWKQIVRLHYENQEWLICEQRIVSSLIPLQ